MCYQRSDSQFKTSENLVSARIGILELNILIRLIQMNFAVFVCAGSDSSAVWWICVAQPVCVCSAHSKYVSLVDLIVKLTEYL